MSTMAPSQRTSETSAITAPPAPPRPNTVLTDLVEAIKTYPQTHLTVQIYAVDPAGGSFNVGENATFKLRVHNGGPLHVHNLTLLMAGLNGSKVGEHGWTSGQSSLQTLVFPRVSAHMEDDTWVEAPVDHYHLFVHRVLPPASDLLRVSIKDWDTDFEHPTGDHSDPVLDANDIYKAEVLGD